MIALAVLIFDVHRQLPTANQTPTPPLRNSYPLILITIFLVAVGVIYPYDHVDWEKFDKSRKLSNNTRYFINEIARLKILLGITVPRESKSSNDKGKITS